MAIRWASRRWWQFGAPGREQFSQVQVHIYREGLDARIPDFGAMGQLPEQLTDTGHDQLCVLRRVGIELPLNGYL